ncbi:FHA domain-containing protein, partial [Streptomyces sp. G2]|uniref:FHA domain-containing protein n=1 Tax=Streptomyces sp. G2 TaxID=1684471 RepID=UPI00202DCC73
MGERPVAPAAPGLVLLVDGVTTRMNPGRVYRVGRDPTSDIVLVDARASWHHAVLRAAGGQWTLADEDSTNGTYADGVRVRLPRVVGPGTVVRFGHPEDGPRAVLSSPPGGPGAAAPGRPAAAARRAPAAPPP